MRNWSVLYKLVKETTDGKQQHKTAERRHKTKVYTPYSNNCDSPAIIYQRLNCSYSN